MSYNSRLENFEWFIIFLSKTPEYNPNEEDLKIKAENAEKKRLRKLSKTSEKGTN